MGRCERGRRGGGAECECKSSPNVNVNTWGHPILHLTRPVYDVDSKNLDNLKEHDFLGAAEFSLGEICASHGQSETKELKVPAAPGKNHGYVTLHVEVGRCLPQGIDVGWVV